jgi:hypothetical protein
MSSYLESWPGVLFDGYDKGTAANVVQISKSVMETLKMIRQAFGEESMSRDKSMSIIFFDIMGIVHNELALGRPNSQFRILL